jgi:hypothetical protein
MGSHTIELSARFFITVYELFSSMRKLKSGIQKECAMSKIPRSEENNYTNEMAAERRAFIKKETGV